MVSAGLGFGFMPANCIEHPGVVALPVVEPEFWREVGLISVRGRRHSPGVGALVHEAMRNRGSVNALSVWIESSRRSSNRRDTFVRRS